MFNALLNEQNIDDFYAQNTEVKANYAEQVIKTIKTKLYQYIIYKQPYCYVDKLQDFARNYNSTYHRTIGMPPDKVTKDRREMFVWGCIGKKDTHHTKTKTSKETL